MCDVVLDAVISPSPATCAEAVGACRAAARDGPAHAIHSMTALGLLGEADEAFAVAAAYYFRDGPNPVPLHHGPIEPVLNEQHRRLTQILFTPAFATMRDDPRFASLCTRIGLSRYWDESGLRPERHVGSRNHTLLRQEKDLILSQYGQCLTLRVRGDIDGPSVEGDRPRLDCLA